MRLFRYFPVRHTPEQAKLEKRIVKHSLFLPLIFIAIMWLVKLFEVEFDLSLVRGGIYPHRIESLTGIITAPFIHGDFGHLMANSIPMFILMFALLFFYRNLAYRIFTLIFLLSGICVWLGAREAWHIGASGVVYGLASFLFLSGIIRNDTRLLTLSIVVVFLYGGMFWGIFPIKPNISWESHLWGGLSGIVLAIIYRNQGPPKQTWHWDEEDDEEHESEKETNTKSEKPYRKAPESILRESEEKKR